MIEVQTHSKTGERPHNRCNADAKKCGCRAGYLFKSQKARGVSSFSADASVYNQCLRGARTAPRQPSHGLLTNSLLQIASARHAYTTPLISPPRMSVGRRSA